MDCDCCSPADGGTDAAAASLDTELPEHVSDALGTALGQHSADTLDDWVASLAEAFPAWPPAVDDLCHDPDGPHRASTPGGDFRFVCVLDAMLLPGLLGDPVTIESTPPVGDDVTIHLDPDGSVDAPDGAVVSVGAVSETPPAGDPTPEHAYGALCPAIHAFPSLSAYETWAATTDAETAPLSVDRAAALAARMVAAE
jgi:hypothetical protein